MFGMLDYRAHKLFVLFIYPSKVFIYSIGFLVVPITAYFLAWYYCGHIEFSKPVTQLVIAIAIMEIGLSIPFWIICKILIWVPSSLFNHLIDVIPTGGRTKEEAELVVQSGHKAIAILNMRKSPELWTDDDIEGFLNISVLQRWFFRQAIEKRIWALQRYYCEHHSTKLTQSDSKKILKENGLQVGILEHAITNSFWRNLIFKYVVLVSSFVFIAHN